MKIISMKAAKAAIERKRYGAQVLAEFDRQNHEQRREAAEKRADVRRKARNAR